MRPTTFVKLAGSGLLALILLTLVATAGGRPAAAEGADVITGLGCALTSHNVPGLGVLTTTDSHSVTTPSGNTSLICQFTFDPSKAPSRAVQNSGFLCGTPGGVTTDSRSVVSPGGKATLICQIKAK